MVVNVCGTCGDVGVDCGTFIGVIYGVLIMTDMCTCVVFMHMLVACIVCECMIMMDCLIVNMQVSLCGYMGNDVGCCGLHYAVCVYCGGCSCCVC